MTSSEPVPSSKYRSFSRKKRLAAALQLLKCRFLGCPPVMQRLCDLEVHTCFAPFSHTCRPPISGALLLWPRLPKFYQGICCYLPLTNSRFNSKTHRLAG